MLTTSLLVAMRLRLGAPQTLADCVCTGCGERTLDMKAYHALCCARSENTIGHNRIRDQVAAYLTQSDPATTIGSAQSARGDRSPLSVSHRNTVLTRQSHPASHITELNENPKISSMASTPGFTSYYTINLDTMSIFTL